MFQELQQAIELRSSKQFDSAMVAFTNLIRIYPDNALVHYHFAWLFDNLGQETNALPHYEKAIQLGLPGNDLREALLGLGSTYRTVGLYQKSAETFEQAIQRFPDANEFKVFYAMTLYNLGRSHEAVTLLLKHIAGNSRDENVLKYASAIDLYANDLDKIWE